MDELQLFLMLQLAVLFFSVPITENEALQEYKPETITDNPEQDAFSITIYVIFGTLALLAMKFLKLSFAFLIDISIFISGMYFPILIGAPALSLFGPLISIFLLWARRAGSVILFNLSTAASILVFSLLFGSFIDPETSLLLLSFMSLYDVISVLYTKHMKFLWMRYKLGRFRKSLVFLFPRGEQFSIVGSGDFSLPLLFTITMTRHSFVAGSAGVLFSTLGFLFLKIISGRTVKIEETGLPGIPTIALSCAFCSLFLSAFGLI